MTRPRIIISLFAGLMSLSARRRAGRFRPDQGQHGQDRFYEQRHHVQGQHVEGFDEKGHDDQGQHVQGLNEER